VHEHITTHTVIDTFTWCINRYGPPQSTLSDNGRVHTTRLLKGLNDFEKLLIALGLRQKNRKPYHPQPQGKIERFHRTEHLWVNALPRDESIVELQAMLDEFQ